MSISAQKRALKNYRARLSSRGIARFEVLGREADRELIRAIARQLAEEGPKAKKLRQAVAKTIETEPPSTGGVLAALRRSPLVGANIEFRRDVTRGRKVDL